MTSVTDLRMQLNLEVNEGTFISQLNNIKQRAFTGLDAHVRSYERMMNEKAKIEQKFFTAEENRDVKLQNLITLQDQLNLSERALIGLLDEIQAQYEKEAGITARLAAEKVEAERLKIAAVKEQQQAEEDRLKSMLTQRKQLDAHVQSFRKDQAKQADEQFTSLFRPQQDSHVKSFRAQQEKDEQTRLRALQVQQDAHVTAYTIMRNEEEKLNASRRTIFKIRQQQNAAIAAQEKANATQYDQHIVTFREAIKQEEKLNASRRIIFKIREQQNALTKAAEKEQNTARQKAINLVRALETEEQRLTRITNELTVAFNTGAISLEDYNRSLANVERRQLSMQGSGGKMGYFIGNLATGAEDFATVMSITGFSMDSFSASARAASNNVSQAVRGFGTGTALMLAPLASIATIGLGFAIPSIYKWATGAEEATTETRKFSDAIKELNQVEQRMRDNNRALADIMNLDSSASAESSIKKITRDLEDYKAVLENLRSSTTVTSSEIMSSVFGGNEFNNDRIIAALRSMGPGVSATAADAIEDAMNRIRAAIESGQIKLVQDAIANLNGVADRYETVIDKATLIAGGSGTWFGNALTLADTTDLAEKLQEVVNARKEEADAVNNVTQAERELAETRKRADELAKEEILSSLARERMQKEDELAALRLAVQRNSASPAQQAIMDLALRRREIVESGLGSPQMLEGLFNQELIAKEKAIRGSLEPTLPTGAADTASVAQAMVDAQRQMFATVNKPEDEERKKQTELLKAIRDHLAGKIPLQVVDQ